MIEQKLSRASYFKIYWASPFLIAKQILAIEWSFASEQFQDRLGTLPYKLLSLGRLRNNDYFTLTGFKPSYW